MKKSIIPMDHFCPQPLFLYGIYKDNGKANFGLFSWFTYYFDDELGIVACIGGEKLTRERIHITKRFSANLVTEEILSFADYFGNIDGNKIDKSELHIDIEKGQVLDIPIIVKSPWIYELEVNHSIPMNNGEVFFCNIKNVLAEDYLCKNDMSIQEKFDKIRIIHSAHQKYFNWDGTFGGSWGEPMQKIKI